MEERHCVQITMLENKVETLTLEKIMIEVCFKTHNDKAGTLWPGLAPSLKRKPWGVVAALTENLLADFCFPEKGKPDAEHLKQLGLWGFREYGIKPLI